MAHWCCYCIALLVSGIMIVSPSSGLSLASSEANATADSAADLVLIEPGPFAGCVGVEDAMNSLGIPSLATYNSSRLAYANASVVSLLQTRGFLVEKIRNGSMTGRGAYRFDVRFGEPTIPSDLGIATSDSPNYDKYMLKFIGPVKEEWTREVESLGVRLLEYLPYFSFVAAASEETVLNVAKCGFVSWTGLYQPAYKLNPDLIGDKNGSVDIIVTLFSGEGSGTTIDIIAKYGGVVQSVWSDQEKAVYIAANVSSEAIIPLALLKEVSWIQKSMPASICNDQATWVVQNYPVHERRVSVNHELNGDWQIITFADTGLTVNHNNWVSPLKIVDYYPVGDHGDNHDQGIGHGTHVAGIAVGDAMPIYEYDEDTFDGHAHGAGMIMQDIGDNGDVSPPGDLTTLYQPSYDADPSARIHSDSWGYPGDSYTSRCHQTDEFMWNHPDYLVIFAAGNEGPGGSTIRDTGNTKNCVTVGATWNNKDGHDGATLVGQSSRGPAGDGRLKPTVCAPGWKITSVDFATYNGYKEMSGTSMATPAVAGCAAMIRQYYVDGYYPTGVERTNLDQFAPSAALVKATLINSASDCTGGTAGPDNGEGWGHVVLDDALYFLGDARRMAVVDNTVGISSSGSSLYCTVQVTDSAQPLKITLVWTDYPGAEGANPAIVNDLDLDVWDPAGNQYPGNRFTGAESQTGWEHDHLNVEECVHRLNPTVGKWLVRIYGWNIVHGPQPFALLATGALDPFLLWDDFSQSSPGFLPGWEYVATPAGNSVGEDLSIGMVSAPSVVIYKGAASGQASARHNFGNQRGELVVQAKVMVSSTSAGWYYVMLMNGNLGYIVHFALKGGQFAYYDGSGSGWHNIGLGYQKDTWYALTFGVHLRSGYYDIYVNYSNGCFKFTDAMFYDHVLGSHSVSCIQFQAGYSAQSGLQVWADDIYVKEGGLCFGDSFQDSSYADWSVTTTSPNIVEIYADGKWSSPSLHLSRTGAGSCQAKHSAVNNKILTAEAYLKVHIPSTSTNKFYFLLMQDASYVVYMWFERSSDGNHIWFRQGGVDTDTGFVAADGSWHLVRLVALLAIGTYDIFVDNNLVYHDARFGDGVLGPHTMNYIQMQAGYSSSEDVEGWVDDITVNWN